MGSASIAFGGVVTMAKKSAKKAGKKPAVMRNPIRKAAETASHVPPAFGKPEIKKIQGLLKSKTADGVTLALSLLESLGATRADYEAVFTEPVIRSVVKGWVAESWHAVAKALVPHRTLSKVFEEIAKKTFARRPRKYSLFNGLELVAIAMSRPAFLAKWGGETNPKKPFLDLVTIPAGAFTMGSAQGEADRIFHGFELDDSRSFDEGWDESQVDVRLTNRFEIGRTVVTQAQWRAVMGTEPWSDESQCGDEFPAVWVSWDDAVLFCQTLTALKRETGQIMATQSYRLPTEAEWEYACRAGTTTAYAFGNSPKKLKTYGWFRDPKSNLHKVARKKPNRWGLFDVHGNVDEWCADWYAHELAGGDDPVGPATGTERVSRGGNANSDAFECRSATRFHHSFICCGFTGFRVVLAKKSAEASSNR